MAIPKANTGTTEHDVLKAKTAAMPGQGCFAAVRRRASFVGQERLTHLTLAERLTVGDGAYAKIKQGRTFIYEKGKPHAAIATGIFSRNKGAITHADGHKPATIETLLRVTDAVRKNVAAVQPLRGHVVGVSGTA